MVVRTVMCVWERWTVVVHTDSDVCENGGRWLHVLTVMCVGAVVVYVLTVMCVWAMVVLQYELIVGGSCEYCLQCTYVIIEGSI